MPTSQLRFVSLWILHLIPALATATTIPPGSSDSRDPLNWTKTSSNGQFIFVMRETNPSPKPLASEKANGATQALRYPVSGLYRTSNRELVWSTDVVVLKMTGTEFHHILVLDDGIHVIWLSHTPLDPTNTGQSSSWWSGSRQRFISASGGNPELARQAIGVKLIAAGKLVGAYKTEDLVSEESQVPQHYSKLWPWIVTADTSGNELILETVEEQRLTFDMDTGELTDRRPRSHFSWLTLAFVIGLVISLGMTGFIFYRRSAQTSDHDVTPMSNRPE